MEPDGHAAVSSDRRLPTFRVGTLLSPLDDAPERPPEPRAESVRVHVPARVATFVCHYHYFAMPPRPNVYPVCDVNFVVDRHTLAEVEITDGPGVEVEASADSDPIVRHAALIVGSTLGITAGLRVRAEVRHDVRHGGLGSSASLMAATACAINELYGRPLSTAQLVRLIARNYGEESDVPDRLVTMPCVGGAAASALGRSSVVVIGGENEVRGRADLPDGYRVVIGMPPGTELPTGTQDMTLFLDNRDLIVGLGEWGAAKESLLRRCTGALVESRHGDLVEAINHYSLGAYGDVQGYFKSRWKHLGIDYPSLMRRLHCRLFLDHSPRESCAFVSSGGPGVCVVTPRADEALAVMADEGFSGLQVCELWRSGPRVVLDPVDAGAGCRGDGESARGGVQGAALA